MYLYKIINLQSDSCYIGITKNCYLKRLRDHKSAARRGTKNKFYDAIRSYGEDNFIIGVIKEYTNYNELLQAEFNTIKEYKESGKKVYNILDGGKSYFPIVNKEAWKVKLRKARKGRKPALGMKHTDKNKELFKKISKEYWNSVETYPKEKIVKLSFKEAKEKYGISKTHYYRIRKQLGKN